MITYGFPAAGSPARKSFFALALLTILIVNVFRFYNLNDIPYGAQVDELAGAVTVQCLATEGIDAHNRHWPLFSDLNFGTPKPPTYLYPAVFWSKIFGFSIGSFRALSAFIFVLGLAGLFFLGRRLFDVEFGIWAVLLGSISPWVWNLSRVSFESLSAVTFLVWGLMFALRSSRARDAIGAGICFSLAMYAYPPERLQVPLILLPLALYLKSRSQLTWKSIGAFFAAFILTTLPLAVKILSGALMSRFYDISIFSKEYLVTAGKTGSWADIARIFFSNYFSHFRFVYLFVTGDMNYVHSTRLFGILSWPEALAVAAGFFLFIIWVAMRGRLSLRDSARAKITLVLFLVTCILGSIVPAALTNEGLPHALRTIGAWPFTVLLTSFGLWQVSRRWPVFIPIGIILATVFAVSLLNVYFRDYPQKSKGMFGFWTREQAEAAKSDKDWLEFMYRYRHDDYHFRYYLMNRKNVSCSESRQMWFNLKDYLTAQGVY